MPAGFALINLNRRRNAAARPLWGGKMTPRAAGRAALSILLVAAALLSLTLGRPGTSSADTLTASSVAITSNAGTDNEYHAGDTITATVTFSTAVTGHSSASLAIDVGGVDRSATPEAITAGTTTLAFNYVVTDADRDTDGITVASSALAGTYTHSGHSGAAHTNPTIATALTTAQASHRVNVNTTDYDTDNNGLIEINSLEQLNAVRWDLTGAGALAAANAARYAAAFPARSHSHGCPDTDDADNDPGPCIGYELTRDLDFDDGVPGDRTDDSYYNSGAGFAPIIVNPKNTAEAGYSGVFEGNGHAIANLYINLTGDALMTPNLVGLFGRLESSGTIRGVGITDARVTVTNNGGEIRGGALVGRNYGGTITACYATGAVSVSDAATDPDNYSAAGGLVGHNGGGGTISASYAAAASTATGGVGNRTYAGGLAGLNFGTISASYATGAVAVAASGANSYEYAGGLVALNSGNGTITASYAAGAVASIGTDSNRSTNLGGLAAANISGSTITDSYWDTATSGQSTSDGGGGQTTAELREPTGYTGIYANWNVNLDGVDGGDDPWRFGSDSQYPILYFARQPAQRPAADYIADDSGAEDAPFVDYDADDDRLIEVKTMAQLNAIRYDLDGDGSASNVAYNLAFPNRDTVAPNANGCIAACQGYELAADLDFDTNGNGRTHTAGEGDRGDTYYNGGAGFAPIGGHDNASSVNNQPFAAILEGNGHTISNLYINLSTAGNNEGYYVALFGRLTGTVRNVGLVNPYVKNTRTGVTGYIYTGALAGWSSRAVTVSRSYVSGGSVAGSQGGTGGSFTTNHVGCLIGSSWGVVSDSWASCDAKSTGTITSGRYYAGGLIGGIGRSFVANARGGAVRDSYARGNVTVNIANTTIPNSAAGGLVGTIAYYASVTRSYATGNVTNNNIRGYTGGLVGSAVSSSAVSQSFATGDVAVTVNNSFAGGLMGGLDNASVTASYAIAGNISSSGGNSDVGGLVGSIINGGTVHTSFAASPVTASGNGSKAGGLVGSMSASTSWVSHSYAAGAVKTTGGGANNLGGLVGRRVNNPSISYSYAVGPVTGSGAGTHNAGGLVGGTSASGTVTASYWDRQTTGQTTSSGGFTTGYANGHTTTDLQGPTGYNGIYSAWGPGSGNPWRFGTAAQYPTLQYLQDALGLARQITPPPAAVDYDRDGDNLIEVASLTQLNAIRWDPDGNGTSARAVAAASGYLAAFPGMTTGMGCATRCTGYELEANLNFARDADGAAYANWTPIGTTASPYSAVFRGNGHTIANLTGSSSAAAVGLFGAVSGAGAVIESVGLTNVSLTATFSSPGFHDVGALVGSLADAPGARGAVRTSYAAGKITVTARGSGTIARAGGLVGHAGAGSSIAASYAKVSVAVGVDSAAGAGAGGLAGVAEGSVTAAYATGRVVASRGENSQAQVGGLLGAQDGTTTVSASYWDTNASRIADDADDLPPEGKTAAALRSPTGYTGIYAAWDDADVDGDGRPDRPWHFGDRCQYPALAIGGHRPSRQRANDPPCADAEYVAPPIVYNLNIRFNVRGITLDEGQSTTYRVRMSEPPVGHPARVSITSNNPDVTVSPTAVYFTAADYNRWQTVAVTTLRDTNSTDESANLAHRGPNYSYGSIIVSVSDTWPGAVAEQVNGHTVTMRHELEAPPGVTVTLTAPDTLDTDSDITIGGPPADAPNGAPGYGIGQSPPARMLAAIRVRGTPAAGLTICLPAPAALLAEAGEHPLTLLRYANGVWTLVAGSERRDRGDGIGAVLVCAAGVMEYGLFAVAYTLPELGPVSNLAAAPGDTAGTITLTWTPGANATAHWIAGVIQTEPYRLAIWQISENPGSQAFSGLDSRASYIFTVTAGRGEGDSSEWTAWAPWVSATPD